MKIVIAQRVAAVVACVGMVAQPALATTPVAVPAIADIALAEGGLFTGKVVNAQGAPLTTSAVSLQQAGNEVASTVTDEQGVFAVQGLRGGLYQVVSEGGVVSYRLWAPNTAPPAANQSALIVTGDEIVNGQYCGPAGCPPASCPPGGRGAGVLGWMREHPILVAAGIATAIAVPLALADDDDPASP
ncbi:hypothetical protein Pla108_37360 [Botrimarina colliarenosi]|uniref:Carboxypeptidase regulatory-like domain-containing protein n=1 Tax=Botrimarina colliarenosi TaxID=2528001 RepID=A0A5C6A3S8_9BACT|nr:carboxypeptidase-like regulatory domain-containing protein [Botrimarina colliarenosi]TWT94025.1 hypothetical protein Pla108_37360 [Botrimarina colliarenosi]